MYRRKVFTNFFLINNTWNYEIKKLFSSKLLKILPPQRISPVDQLKFYSNFQNLIKFSSEESVKILEIINTKSPEELISYDITKVRSAKIHAWRNKNGYFKDLEDILEVDGFSIKILEKFAKSILDDKKKSQQKKNPRFTIPYVNDTILENCQSCLSLYIGVASVAWSRIQLNDMGLCTLTHWNQCDFVEKKLHLNDLIQRCIQIESDIPKADCYVIESPQVAVPGFPGSPNQVNINIQKAQLTAILSFILAKRKFQADGETGKQISNLFYLKRFLASRLFNLLVGTERVSAEKIILDLMHSKRDFDYSEELDLENISRNNFVIPAELMQHFKNLEGFQREFLGQSLLIGLTFIRLEILRCPESLKKFIQTGESLG